MKKADGDFEGFMDFLYAGEDLAARDASGLVRKVVWFNLDEVAYASEMTKEDVSEGASLEDAIRRYDVPMFEVCAVSGNKEEDGEMAMLSEAYAAKKEESGWKVGKFLLFSQD